MLVWNLYRSNTDPQPVSKVHTSCICVQIEGKMKKQIIQIFHNMINKEAKPGRQSVQVTSGKTGHESGTQVESFVKDDSDIIVASGKSGSVEAWDVPDKTTDRKHFEKVVNDMLREGHKAGSIMIGDLDRFKDINEIYGRDTGNAVLQNAGDILSAHFKEFICTGRVEGDIFALWLPGLSGEDADDIRRRVGMVNDRLLHPEKELPPVSVSVGVAFYKDGDDCRSLGKRASKMLYRVKENGRCGCEISTDL